jgi:rare lipoprotein A
MLYYGHLYGSFLYCGRKYFIFITALAVLLNGCSTYHKTPVGPVCRSCKPYYCRGAMYYPQTYYEYDKIGNASWYGEDFHGKKKASGEKFNKYKLTAAHRTLPLPSVVRVTNLRNNKSVIVIVDDRGPYTYKGRIIDLSYNAAKAIDLHRFKPSPVRVECLAEESLKLSHRIAKRKRDKRTWLDIYEQEIARTRPINYSYYIEPQKKITKTKTSDKNSKMVKYLNRKKI